MFVGVINPDRSAHRDTGGGPRPSAGGREYIPIAQLGTCDDCGFSPFCDDTTTTRETAFAKIRARVEGTALASDGSEARRDSRQRRRGTAPRRRPAKCQSILVARRRAEEALRQQSEWLRITLASIGDAVITTDADGRVTFMNAVAQALTGWSQTDALGHLLTDVFRIVHEDTRQPVDNPAIRALRRRHDRPPGQPHRSARANGRRTSDRRQRRAHSRRVGSHDRCGTGVSRRRPSGNAPSLARAHLAAIVESSDDAIVSKTLQGVILSWNKGAERLFGYTRRRGRRAAGHDTACHPSVSMKSSEILARIVRGERIEHFETVRVAKDGHRIDISLTISPIRDAGGEIVGASKVARDISRRKSLEAEQVLAREELDGLRKAAESANRAKDEFLAMLGHELRNPLSPILTALQLMKLRGGDELERERTVIERQVSHLTRLVDDLLDVSRIARGKVELKEELVEIAEVVAKAIEIATPLLDQRAHALDVDVPRGLWVRGDSIRLNQVVSNLLTNAAKYTPPGGRITVRAAEERGEIVIRVRDTGIGIAADVLPHVFDLVRPGAASHRSIPGRPRTGTDDRS